MSKTVNQTISQKETARKITIPGMCRAKARYDAASTFSGGMQYQRYYGRRIPRQRHDHGVK